jgi:serine/threonine protein kinase
VSERPKDKSPTFPERLGRYELLLPIGTGGMATVYLARHRGAGGFEREVAVKVMHEHLRSDDESKLQLLDEARLAARIRHPNVVPTLEVAEEPFGLFLVMDYVEGESLAGLLRLWPEMEISRRNRLLARIMSDALAGLEAAHQLKDEAGELLSVVHRDFSPHNIMVGVDGVARLTDFSVAKANDRAVRTRTGLVKGKIGYMSPEQARGHQVDPRCDVWAAGVILWELAAGKRLFPKGDAVSTLLKIVTDPPPPLSSVVPDIDPEFEAAVASALTMDAQERCASAAELRRRLEAYWSRACGIASHEEVAGFVTELTREALRERRLRIGALLELRQRMSEVARHPALPSAGTLEPFVVDSGEETEAAPRTASTAALGGVSGAGVGRTGQSSTAQQGSARASRLAGRNWLLAAAAGGVLLGALGVFWWPTPVATPGGAGLAPAVPAQQSAIDASEEGRDAPAPLPKAPSPTQAAKADGNNDVSGDGTEGLEQSSELAPSTPLPVRKAPPQSRRAPKPRATEPIAPKLAKDPY